MEVVNRNRVNPFVTKDTSEIREILSPRNSSIKGQSLAEAKLVPGKVTEEHYHSRVEEIYYILRGRGKMFVEDEDREVKTGDGIVILSGKRHKMENTGSGDLVFLCCCTPAYTHEDTVLTGQG